ncbi:DNA modification methylase [Microbacterium sp. NPDC090007]|uniref:DNA modification methylase n=1 Tax=Microbacterium sp. NPDC090007 TaxID=3364204 RepID=UPI0037FE7FC1
MTTATSVQATGRPVPRRVAIALLAGILVTGLLSACDTPAEPADEGGAGVAIDGLEPLEVRNALIVTSDGQTGAFVAGIVNNSDQDLTLRVTLRGETVVDVEVGASSTLSYGGEGLTQPPVIQNLDAAAGSTIELGFSSEDGSDVREQVPVLDESLDYLRGLAP